MVKVYATALALAVLGLIVVIYGGALMESLGREHRDPGRRIGVRGRMALGGMAGFGMAGMSAEFSPLDLGWPTALSLALLGAGASAIWVRFASKETTGSDAGPV